MATPVSEFYAKLGIRVDQRSLKVVDKFFSDIEKRMGKLGTTLSGTRGTVAGLAGVAKETEAVAKAERKRSIERSRQVRQAVADNNKLFQSEKKLADLINKNLGIGQVSGGFSRGDRQRMYSGLFGINSSLSSRSGRKSGAFNRLSGLRNAESSILNRVAEEKAAAEIRRRSEKQSTREAQARLRLQERHANTIAILEKRAQLLQAARDNTKFASDLRMREIALREENRARRDAERAARRPSAARTQRGNYLAIGGAGGAFARYGVQSLPFVGGAYGISQLNTANQQFMSREISSGAIFGERATQAKEWLRKHADYVGYNYLDTMPIFTQFMAGAMPTMGYETGLGVFEGLAEFGRTRGADAVGMQRAMRAVSQMSSKGTVTSEELNYRLAA